MNYKAPYISKLNNKSDKSKLAVVAAVKPFIFGSSK